MTRTELERLRQDSSVARTTQQIGECCRMRVVGVWQRDDRTPGSAAVLEEVNAAEHDGASVMRADPRVVPYAWSSRNRLLICRGPRPPKRCRLAIAAGTRETREPHAGTCGSRVR